LNFAILCKPDWPLRSIGSGSETHKLEAERLNFLLKEASVMNPTLSPCRRLPGSSKRAGWFALIAMLVAFSSSTPGQTPETYNVERQRAFQLFDEHKLMDALPLLEKLAAAKPDDIAVLERFGFALAARSVSLADAAERRKLRVRAREVMLQSKKLGNDSHLMQ